MTIFLRWLRIRLALACFLLFAATIGLLHFFLHSALGRLAGNDGLEQCQRASRWFVLWCRIWLWLYRTVGGIKFRLLLPPSTGGLEIGATPFLAVANHHGAFDAALLCELASATGRGDFRTVTMREAGEWPLIGSILRTLRFAFVRRSRDDKDVEDLRIFAAQAYDDAASIMIFPEGHIYTGAKEGSEYNMVLPPKPKGLKALMERLPGYPILSVTINWHDFDYRKSGLLGVIPPGNEVTVSARLVPGVSVDNLGSWLTNEWRKKDAILSAPRR